MTAKDSFSTAEVAGYRVIDEPTGEVLGLLTDVLPSGSNDVWVIQGSAGEIMLPALRSVVRRVVHEDKCIVVVLPPGLREIYRGLPGPDEQMDED